MQPKLCRTLLATLAAIVLGSCKERTAESFMNEWLGGSDTGLS
jgi:hypothetical protein